MALRLIKENKSINSENNKLKAEVQRLHSLLNTQSSAPVQAAQPQQAQDPYKMVFSSHQMFILNNRKC